MKNKPTIFLLLLFTCFSFSQDKQLKPDYPVPYTIFKTTADTISVSDMGKLRFQDASVFPKTHPDDTYWVQIDFSQYDELIRKENWILQIGYMHKSEVFYQTENGIQSKKIGSFQLNNKFTGQFPFSHNNLIEGRYLYLKFSFLTVRGSLNIRFITSFPKSMLSYRKSHISKRKSTSNIFSSLLLGGAFMGSIIALMFFRTYRRREYIFYIFYVLGVAFYLSRGSWEWYNSIIGLYSKTNFLLNIILELFSNLFYLLFVRHFLDTRNRYPLLDKAITYAIAVTLFFLVAEIASIIIAEYTWHGTLLDIRAIFLSALVLFGMVYLTINRKTNLNWYIVAGSFLYGLGSILLYSLYTTTYLKMCILAEITVFLFGIGYKIRKENEEKMHIQEVSIQNYRKLLRTQINPHFIFNSLNSIQHLITKNERVSAIKYLNKFSKLMRQTLESSIENSILLSEEIEFLNTYLELESFRFNDLFQYQINVGKNLCPHNIEMPQLMIQPFVENAILHGLLNKKEGEKILTISFKRKDHFIECTIDDNGIGRKASEAIKRFDKNKTSRGMEVTQKRIKTLFSEEIDQELLTITDKTDSDGNPTGTTVVLHIPIQQ